MASLQTPVVALGTRFLEALGRRDYDALGTCFAPDATLRAVVPPGVREADGRDAVVERFRIWTGTIEDYEIVDADAAEFADLMRLRWAVRGVDSDVEGTDPTTYEQTAYAEVEGGLISRMRVACSGHRPA